MIFKTVVFVWKWGDRGVVPTRCPRNRKCRMSSTVTVSIDRKLVSHMPDCRRHPDSTVSLSTGRPSNSILSVLRDNSLFLKKIKRKFNPLIAALKPQSNGPSYSVYSDWYTGRWWVGCCVWYSDEGTGRGRSPPRPLFAVPDVTAHPSTASVPTSYYSM